MALTHSYRLQALALAFLFLATLATAQTPTQLPGQAAPATPVSSQTGGENQQLFEVKVNANQTKITPDLRDETGRPLRSFLTPGKNVTADFSYFQDHSFGTKRLQILSIVRSNNDPRVDPEYNSLQRGYVRVTTPNWDWNFGDSLVSYSRLTLSQNTRGVSVSTHLAQGFRLKANAGAFTDRWGSLWKEDLIGKPFTRVVAGFRVEQQIGQDKVWGVNFSHGRDQIASIRPDLRSQFGLIPTDNQVASIDTRMTFNRVFTVDAEMAYSNTNFDLQQLHGKRGGYGGRLDTSLRAGRYYMRTNYVRLMPRFLSVNARQLADLQDAGVRAGVDVTDNFTLEASYRRTNNNLQEDRPEGTTLFRVPEVRASFRKIPHLGQTLVDVGYRVRMQDGPFRLTDPMLGHRERRRVPIPFVEVSVPFGSTLLSVGYERRMNNNDLLPSEDTSANRWSGSFRSNFDLGNWTFAPLFRYEMEREEFFRVFGFNTNRSLLASAFVDAPKYFAFDAMYRVVGASLFAECIQTAGGAPCAPFIQAVPGTTILLPSGFRRPALRAAVTYKIQNNEDRFLVFAFERNTNLFALPDRDFRERVFSVTFVYRLRR